MIIDGEHWKAACLSTWPARINSVAKDESSVMDGASHAEIHIHSYGSRGEYVSTELKFWIELPDGELVDVKIDVVNDYKWIPDRKASFNRSGECSSFTLTPKFIGEDQRRKWWGEKPGYSLSYYWADKFNFESFVSNNLK